MRPKQSARSGAEAGNSARSHSLLRKGVVNKSTRSTRSPLIISVEKRKQKREGEIYKREEWGDIRELLVYLVDLLTPLRPSARGRYRLSPTCGSCYQLRDSVSSPPCDHRRGTRTHYRKSVAYGRNASVGMAAGPAHSLWWLAESRVTRFLSSKGHLGSCCASGRATRQYLQRDARLLKIS